MRGFHAQGFPPLSFTPAVLLCPVKAFLRHKRPRHLLPCKPGTVREGAGESSYLPERGIT